MHPLAFQQTVYKSWELGVAVGGITLSLGMHISQARGKAGINLLFSFLIDTSLKIIFS